MFEITVFSVFTTSLFLSGLMLIFMAVTSSKKVISKLSMWAVTAFVLFVGIRLLLPFEADFTKAIRSYAVMPMVKEVINYNVFSISENSFKITPLFIIAAVWSVGSGAAFYKYFRDYLSLCKISKYIPETDNPMVIKVLDEIRTNNNFRFKTRVNVKVRNFVQ
ncbi:MAG: hypothetical protein LUG24_09735 [Clostridiales bacterium]|nr:hypothetical protein [Clostridiales bacterium]